MFTQDPSLPSQSQSQPPRRLEGFHVSTTISIPNHQTDSQILQQQQQHHHHHTTSFNHFNGFGSNFSSTPSGHVTDAELLDSLIAQTSSSFNFDDQLQNTSFSSSNPSNHDQLSNQPNSFQSSQQHQPQPHTPLRTLPRHLDQSHGSPSISNSPLSPNDLYSPNSTGYNSSAPTHQNDIFAEHHYGSFSSAPPEDAPRSGRATSMSGRAPAPRSRSARRPSGSFPTNHPNNGSRHSLLLRSSALSIPNGNSESETPLAISAPTYLSSLNLGSNRPSKTASPDPGGWSTPNQIETHQTSNSSMIGFQQTHQHHHSNGFSKFDSSGLNSSPADSVLSHQTQILGTHPIIKDEMNSLIGSPALLRSTSVEVHQDLNHLDSNNVVLNEKKKKRRESHNAVERRRRENINDRIAELFTLLPSCMTDGGNGNGGMGMTVEEESHGHLDSISSNLNSNNLNNPKHNKGFILTKSVEYIKQLKDIISQHTQENAQLRLELDLIKNQTHHQNKTNDVFLVHHHHHHPSDPQVPSDQWTHPSHSHHQVEDHLMNLES